MPTVKHNELLNRVYEEFPAYAKKTRRKKACKKTARKKVTKRTARGRAKR